MKATKRLRLGKPESVQQPEEGEILKIDKHRQPDERQLYPTHQLRPLVALLPVLRLPLGRGQQPARRAARRREGHGRKRNRGASTLGLRLRPGRDRGAAVRPGYAARADRRITIRILRRGITHGAISKAFELLGAFVEVVIEIAEQSAKNSKPPSK